MAGAGAGLGGWRQKAYLFVIAGVPVIHQIIQQLRFPEAAHGCLAQPGLLQQVGKLVASISA